MTTTALDLPVVLPRGAECAECVEEFGDGLRRLRGVRDVTADVPRGLLHVSFDNDAPGLRRPDARRTTHRRRRALRRALPARRVTATCDCELVVEPSARRALRAAPHARHRPRLRRLRAQARGRPAAHRRRRERDHELRRVDPQGGLRPRRDRLRPGPRARTPARLRHPRGAARPATPLARTQATATRATSTTARPCRPRPRRTRRRARGAGGARALLGDAAHHAHGDRRRGGRRRLRRRGRSRRRSRRTCSRRPWSPAAGSPPARPGTRCARAPST